jgi:transcription initiation factor IIE alpha subunit
MPKCPSCKEEIRELLEEETTTHKARVQLADEKGTRLFYENEQGGACEYTFDCPKCFFTLPLSDEDAARSFLKSELNLDE